MHDLKGIYDTLTDIIHGIDPITGEIFNTRDLYDNSELRRITKQLDEIAAGKKKPESQNLLNRPAELIFEALREWRLEKARLLKLRPYYIFSDKVLWSIAEGDVCKKEDLLKIKGVSDTTYEAYGDELLEIILRFDFKPSSISLNKYD